MNIIFSYLLTFTCYLFYTKSIPITLCNILYVLYIAIVSVKKNPGLLAIKCKEKSTDFKNVHYATLTDAITSPQNKGMYNTK